MASELAKAAFSSPERSLQFELYSKYGVSPVNFDTTRTVYTSPTVLRNTCHTARRALHVTGDAAQYPIRDQETDTCTAWIDHVTRQMARSLCLPGHLIWNNRLFSGIWNEKSNTATHFMFKHLDYALRWHVPRTVVLFHTPSAIVEAVYSWTHWSVDDWNVGRPLGRWVYR